MATGIFIAFEGIDGSGKSTQVDRFAQWARERGVEPLLVREPGGTALGEQVRSLVLDHATGDIAASAEALLYASSRAELVAAVIAPALAQGRLVIADRFVDSSLAYQGAGRGLGVDRVRAANALAIGDTMPDRTVLVRADVDAANSRVDRAGAATPDRIEAAGRSFFATVARAYDELAAAEPERFVVVDGAGSIDQVHERVVAQLAPLVKQLLAPGAAHA